MLILPNEITNTKMLLDIFRNVAYFCIAAFAQPQLAHW